MFMNSIAPLRLSVNCFDHKNQKNYPDGSMILRPTGSGHGKDAHAVALIL